MGDRVLVYLQAEYTQVRVGVGCTGLRHKCHDEGPNEQSGFIRGTTLLGRHAAHSSKDGGDHRLVARP